MSKPRSLRELDAIDSRLLNEMQDRFPLVPNPFQELGTRLSTYADAAITRVRAIGLAELRQEETLING